MCGCSGRCNFLLQSLIILHKLYMTTDGTEKGGTCIWYGKSNPDPADGPVLRSIGVRLGAGRIDGRFRRRHAYLWPV